MAKSGLLGSRRIWMSYRVEPLRLPCQQPPLRRNLARDLFHAFRRQGHLLHLGEYRYSNLSDHAPAWHLRTFWLILFGRAYAYLLVWPGEIPFAYGVVWLSLYWLLHLNASRLLGLSFLPFLLISGMNIYDMYFVKNLYTRSRVAGEQVVQDTRKGYSAAVRTMAPVPVYIQTKYLVLHLLPNVLSMMQFGMAFF